MTDDKLTAEESDRQSREAFNDAAFGPCDSNTAEMWTGLDEMAAAALEKELTVTFFADQTASSKREGVYSLQSLAPLIRNTTAPVKNQLPWLKLAQFGDKRTDKGSLRNNDNVLSISGIEADYDGERLSVDDALTMLRDAGIAAMVYTSPSHSEDAPRWRVLCPLSWDRGSGDRTRLLARLNGILQGALAAESFRLSQSYYYGSANANPSHRVELIEGIFIDLRDDLDKSAIGPPQNDYKPQRPISSGADVPVSDARLDGYIKSVLDGLKRTATDGRKHHELWNKAVTLGGIQKQAGFTDAQGVQWLVDCLPDTVKCWRSAQQTAEQGLAKGRERPLRLENRERPQVNGHAADIDWAKLMVNGERVYKDAPPKQETGADAGAGQAKEEPDTEADAGADTGADAGAGQAQDEQAEPDPADPSVSPHKVSRDAANAEIARLNEKYMVVSEAGKTVIYKPVFDYAVKRHSYYRMSFGDFKNLYLNKSVRVGADADGNPTYKCVADVWLKSTKRRQYIGGITFDPRRDAPHDPDTLNLWRGFAINPKPGDWSLMQDHMLTIICRRNQEHYEHLLNRLARMVQFPGEQGQVAIVLKSGEGAGKGIFVEPFKRIFGQHAMTVTQPSHLVGHFNAHLRDCVLLFADEAFFAGDRAHNRVLKKIITDNTLEIEGKGQNVIVVPNFLHVIMASNDDWVVPASLDSRRFFVLVLSEARKGDQDYFNRLNDQMEHSGGDAAMLHDLLHRDIRNFNPRHAPVTEGLKEQRKLSLKTEEAWWMDVLHRGYVYRSKLGLEKHFAKWHEWVSNDVLHDSYTEFAKQARERDIMSRDALAKFMKTTMSCKGSRPNEGVVGEHMTDVDNLYGGTNRKAVVRKDHRPRGYRVGMLDAARAGFEAATGLKVDWDGDDGPSPPIA